MKKQLDWILIQFDIENEKKNLISGGYILYSPYIKIKKTYKNYINYRSIKLMTHNMKFQKRVIESKLRNESKVTENQFEFMLERLMIKVIYLFLQVIENK